jgi:glycerol-3-phosphate acyltransferase PlsX
MVPNFGIDASGGDFGGKEFSPEVLQGALQACRDGSGDYGDQSLRFDVTIYGKSDLIRAYINDSAEGSFDNLRIVDCPKRSEEVKMAMAGLQNGQLSAFITALHNDALLAHGRKFIVDGVKKPALFSPFPAKNPRQYSYFMDAGATALEFDPEVFLGWANLGRDFLARHLGIENPTVGLLNIASEGACPEIRHIHQRLNDFPGYIGYAEPGLFAGGTVDLLLTSGFNGNLKLKDAESDFDLAINMILAKLSDMPEAVARIVALAKKVLSYDAHLISPVLGFPGWVFRVHGKARAEQIARAFVLSAINYDIQKPLYDAV